jgi:hypothetical protein
MKTYYRLLNLDLTLCHQHIIAYELVLAATCPGSNMILNVTALLKAIKDLVKKTQEMPDQTRDDDWGIPLPLVLPSDVDCTYC